MLDYTTGNIFNSGCQAIVNPVNCVGVMGAGLALQFKERCPENFATYAEACRTGALTPGRVHVFDTGADNPRFIVNFPTKRHWRDPSRLEDIASGIEALKAAIAEHGIRSIAIPPLGSGLGGLAWPDVRRLIADGLADCSRLEILVYEPVRSMTNADYRDSNADQAPLRAQPSTPLLWAGIGSRRTPASVLPDMTEIARRMADAGWHLASGGAEGADAAFAAGTPADRRTFWLPWPRYNDLAGADCLTLAPDRLRQCLAIAARLHPAWNRCSDGVRKLHARNVAILLGPNLDRPVDAVVCWTEGGAVTGGTGMALRIAAERGIPILNLGSMTMEEAWKGLQELRRSLTASGQHTAIAEHTARSQASAPATRTYDPATSCVFRFTRGEWGIFSNFAALSKPIAASDRDFKTSEHLYQAAKFRESPELQNRIAQAASARDAANIGRHADNKPDADWNDRRIDAMRWVIRMKREANPALVDAALQRTGDLPIVEHAPAGAFWGTRPEGERLVGQNVLGRLWMELRQHVRDGDPRALASAWPDPLTPPAHAEQAGSPVPDAWRRIKTDYASLYRAAGERIGHLPHQEGFADFRDLVAGAVRDGHYPSQYADRLKALHRTLQAQDRCHSAVLEAHGRLDDVSGRLAVLKEKMDAEPGQAIETMPGYTAWLRDRDIAVENWRRLTQDPTHREHMQIVAPDMMAPRIAELSNGQLPSIHRANADHPTMASGRSVYTPSLQPLSQVYGRALAFVDRDPNQLAYAPQFDELKGAVSKALDECKHAPDLLDMLTELRKTLDDSHERMTRARTAADDVSNASRTLCRMKSWSDRTGRPIHEAPDFKSCREDADRALRHYEAAQSDPALALHLARADALGVLAETALPLLRDARFREPAVSEASVAAARQRSEQSKEHHSLSA